MCTITRRTNPIPKRQTRRKQVVVSVLSVEKTATDILCELSEETDRGNRHILIVSDCFTKWHLLFQIWRQKLLLEHGKSFRPRSPVRKQNMYRNVSVAWNLWHKNYSGSLSSEIGCYGWALPTQININSKRLYPRESEGLGLVSSLHYYGLSLHSTWEHCVFSQHFNTWRRGNNVPWFNVRNAVWDKRHSSISVGLDIIYANEWRKHMQ